MRSHPPSLFTLAWKLIREEALIQKDDRVLVAVSGGPDSMALLDVLRLACRKRRFQIHAHGVDHGLRKEASAELDLAQSYAREHEIAFERTLVSLEPGGNLQARARAARRDALVKAAARISATCIATAHHADDRAETFLYRLLRGTGPAGLAVLPPKAVLAGTTWIRPLIRARRRDVLLHIERHDLRVANDPSNTNPRFLRVQIRREVLPRLEALNPRVVEHLCALADDLVGTPHERSPFVRTVHRALTTLELNGAGKVLLPGGYSITRVGKPGARERVD